MGEIYAGLARLRDVWRADPREVSEDSAARLGLQPGRTAAGERLQRGAGAGGLGGTCATIVSATLNLTASPPFRVLVALGFADAFVAADAVPLALEYKPIGLEGFDGMLVDFMRRKGLALSDLRCCRRGADSCWWRWARGARRRRGPRQKNWRGARRCWPIAPTARIYSPEEAARVWHVRESALGATVFVPGEPDGWEGWDDAGVPPAQLGDVSAQAGGADGASMATAARFTGTTGRAACTCASISISAARGAAEVSASLLNAQRNWC